MVPSDRQIKRSAFVAGQVLEAFVFAPIGAGAQFVADGPAAIARARQELSNARFIGQMVVGRGASQLKDRLATQSPSEATTQHAEPGLESEPAIEHVEAPEPPEPTAPAVEAEGVEMISDVTADSLAIPDYDSLPAIDIVGQLESLNPTELSAVDAYERSNRRRRTVLGKISQLSVDA